VSSEVAVLFARSDSVYKTLPDCDVWDIDRDARKWPGGAPVVAHPPCRAWGRLRHFAKPRPDEKDLAVAAVANVRAFGGVLEHPACSSLWSHCSLPRPGAGKDEHGGWTLEVRQCDWGHPAEKLTWLYIVGAQPSDLPPMPPRQEPTGLVKPRRGVPRDGRKIITKAARERTPADFARWLTEVARLARGGRL
jgi:hypothetical protein